MLILLRTGLSQRWLVTSGYTNWLIIKFSHTGALTKCFLMLIASPPLNFSVHSDRKLLFLPRGLVYSFAVPFRSIHSTSGLHLINTISQYMFVVAPRNLPTPSEEKTVHLFW